MTLSGTRRCKCTNFIWCVLPQCADIGISDGPIDSSEEYEAYRLSSARSGKNEIFEGDPWNAVCVLGLRVYSFKAGTKVSVVNAEAAS